MRIQKLQSATIKPDVDWCYTRHQQEWPESNDVPAGCMIAFDQ
jgi:hypothetical protein